MRAEYCLYTCKQLIQCIARQRRNFIPKAKATGYGIAVKNGNDRARQTGFIGVRGVEAVGRANRDQNDEII